LYGVDLNPMAVQLARLSLWLATLAVDRPLSFLDHHLQAGNSLLGTWISCLRRPPTDRRQRAEPQPLLGDQPVSDTLRDVLPIRFSLAADPNDTPEHVRAKERTLAALTHRESSLSKWKRVADLWCARWFASELQPRLFSTLSDAVLTGHCALPCAQSDRLLQAAEAAATRYRFFHWELEFPEVFFDADGRRRLDAGFDAVVGNPPWDMVRADHGSSDRRAQSRDEAAAVVRFTRDAGVYDAQSDGHANRYQLFLERSLALTRAGGRVGLVLPAGLAADHGSARLRRLLFSHCNVDALVGFDNKQAIFPIHRSVRFLLLSGTAGEATTSIGCRLGEVDPSVLERHEDCAGRDAWFSVRLSPGLLRRLSGDDLAVPDIRAAVDLTIAERAAALFPPLGSDSGWSARFGRELNATEDRAALHQDGRGLPVVEGKLIEPHRVRLNDARLSISNRDARRLLGDRHQHWRLAYRDVASATNRLTLIAALLPPESASTHTVFCLRTPLPLIAQRFLCGLFNSLVVNYLVRFWVTTHVTTAIVERLPIPREDDVGAVYQEVGSMTRALSRRDDSAIESRLNALVAKMYRLGEEEFAHVLSTFPLIPKEDRDRAMTQFNRM
jgi:hypothetical protein